MPVADEQRPPGADVVDEFIAIGVEDVCRLASNDEGRSASHRTIGANRRIDAARNGLAGPFQKLLRASEGHTVRIKRGFPLQRSVKTCNMPSCRKKGPFVKLQIATPGARRPMSMTCAIESGFRPQRNCPARLCRPPPRFFVSCAEPFANGSG